MNTLSRLKSPLSVNLEVTAACNLSCTFCFNAAPAYEEMIKVPSEGHQDREKKKLMHRQDKDVTVQRLQKERIFRIIDVLSDAEVFEIRLFGGEFTVFKSWKEIIRYAFEKNFFISFVSNGYLLTKDDVLLLTECGVSECTISVHGLEDVHDRVTQKAGSFKKAMQSVALLKERGIVVSIAYTPNAENLMCVYEFVENLFIQHDVRHFSISRLFNDERYQNLNLRDYHRLLEEIDRCQKDFGVVISLADSFPRCKVPVKYWRYLSYCSQGVSFAQVDFNGNLKHCSATSHVLGNVLDTSVEHLWGKELEGVRNLEHLPKSCKICPIFCGGGCTVSRGVQHKFAPDEFIPWPKNETWPEAVVKAIYNRVRKTMFGLSQENLFRKKIKKQEGIKLLYPKITQRYRIRKEDDGSYVAMFDQSGVKSLSPLAAHVLAFLTGEYSIEVIFEKCRKEFPGCTKSEVAEVVDSFV